MGEEISELGRFSDPALFILVSLAGDFSKNKRPTC